MSVLITDAGAKHSLAAIRSIGSRNIDVGAIETTRLNMGFLSRYVKKRFLCPHSKGELFVNHIIKILEKHKYDVFLPVIDTSYEAASKYKARLEKYVRMPVANYDSMSIALNKRRTMMLAEKKGVPVPATVYPIRLSDIRDNAKKITYPAVIKTADGAGSGGIAFVNSEAELLLKYPKMVTDKSNLPMIQEYIPGKGQGFFALYNNGKPRAIFMHERIREYPVTGGPSTMAKSIYSDSLKKEGLKMLNALDWHGVAMVEFKLDSRDNTLKLMEVNPKFWGSLDLAISSGVDFPYLAYKMALDGDVKPVMKYNESMKFRWIFPGEILHFLSSEDKIKALKDFMEFDKNIKSDIRLKDPLPNIFQIMLTARMAVSLSLKGKLRHPCGVAKVN
ncbi:Ribosomal protein S6--L-glutamate ligase [uncultured archaeon]|nr:Ribosomal protein S6--L-glutamate ligase [uncultured archaeon]